MAENGGIIALSGFTYQMKVFYYFLASLQEKQSVSFELIDDVSFSTYNAADLDKYQDGFFTKLTNNISHKIIQIKRTSVNPRKFEKILYNWLLIEGSDLFVENYVLCSAFIAEDKERFFCNSNVIYDKIMKSNLRSDAAASKLKEYYKENYLLFDKNYNQIKSKFLLLDDFKVDDEIYKNYKTLFRRTEPTENIYKLRIEELLRNIQYDLLISINKQEEYTCSYERFISYIETVCEKIKVDAIELSYLAFSCNTNLDIDEVKLTREYKQLEFCKKSENFILRHIMYGLYYSTYRHLSLEDNKALRIHSIENRAYEGYQDVIDRLQEEKKDTPFKRLDECKKERNNYIETDEAKYGTLIYMTRDSEIKKQLSWKEVPDENEK